MASNKIFNFGPVAIANAAGNLLNPPTATGGVNGGSSNNYVVLRHIRVVNKTAGAATFSLFKGATGASAAGTEVVGSSLNVPANSFVDWYGTMRFDTADFLVGSASAAATLTIQGEGEIGVAG